MLVRDVIIPAAEASFGCMDGCKLPDEDVSSPVQQLKLIGVPNPNAPRRFDIR